jgi:homoserine kinase
LTRRTRSIVVPGSISNLGAGFDALSVAVRLHLRLRVERVGPPRDELQFRFVDGPLRGENAIEKALRWIAEREGVTLPSLRVRVASEIPLQAGLGSSGAAIVAGLRLFEMIAGPRPLAQLLRAASAIEGHPDNVAASLLGGLTASCQGAGGSVLAYALPWPRQIRFVVLTPAVRLETKAARRILPDTIPREDAVFNVQRAALFLAAIHSRDRSGVREALRDRLHQPYRQAIVPGLEEALALEHPHLLGVCLSGAGPSIAALVTGNTAGVVKLLGAVYRKTGIKFTVRVLNAQQPF